MVMAVINTFLAQVWARIVGVRRLTSQRAASEPLPLALSLASSA